MWLSDYVDNRLGGFEPEQNKEEKLKPDCALIGTDGNVFSILGMASRTLKQNGMADEAKEMCSRVTSSGSYCEALNIISEYVNITDGSEQSDDIDEDLNEGQAMNYDLSKQKQNILSAGRVNRLCLIFYQERNFQNEKHFS